jgi:uncharacterized damage-inducible protein DinB
VSLFLVEQTRFTRSEFVRSLAGVTAEEAMRRFEPINSISWMVGHLAIIEHNWWVWFAQGRVILPGLNELVGFGKPASTPPLDEMWAAWRTATAAADEYLDSVSEETLTTFLERDGKRRPENVGALLCRGMYHYWYHVGEAAAVRQLLGHHNLPQFVGDMSAAQYHR